MPRMESVEAFLTLLDRSELLSREQMLGVSDVSNSLRTPQELANWLVKQRWLTRWQATQLLEGHEQLRVGKYRLLNLIGRGGMGLVFLAEATTTNANAATVPRPSGSGSRGERLEPLPDGHGTDSPLASEISTNANAATVPRPSGSGSRGERIEPLADGHGTDSPLASEISSNETLSNGLVALKIMTSLGNPIGLKRYLQEVEAATALDHPHIVTTLDSGVADGCHYLVMEFLPGRDLNAIMRDQSPLPVSWSCEVIRQTALGLQYAHEQGLVHRDIKPHNILVTPEPDFLTPHARILDFGLAHIAAESNSLRDVTQTGAVLGTADYIAPEQAMSAKHADIRSDIFGLGCTLFQLITGELPFQGNNVMEKLMARITTIPPSVSALRAEAHSDLDDLVANMLRTNPNDRPQTPAEIASELDRLTLKIRRHELRIGKLSPRKLSPHAQSRLRLRRS